MTAQPVRSSERARRGRAPFPHALPGRALVAGVAVGCLFLVIEVVALVVA